jgi:glycosyltransferase involved in cell wall biosynthesis
MKTKVLFLINSFKNGGPVNMLYTLVKYIDKEKLDITVVALKQCDKDNERDFSDLDCNVITLDGAGVTKTVHNIQKLIEELHPFIIHSHGGVADVVNSRLKGTHKSFSTIHCDPDEDFVMKKGLIEGWIRATVFISTLKRIQVPVACSETVAKNILAKRKFKISYVRNGIDLDKLQYSETITRSELGIAQDVIVLTFCGYLSKRKNVGFLVNALKRVKRNDIYLLIIGDGTEYESLKQQAADDNRVVFAGRSSCPAKYLRISDYFVSSSLSEGLPLAVMEGMGCGLLAVLSDIGSHQEMKRCCDEAVRLFTLQNTNELENILEKLTVNQNAREKAQKAVFDYLNAKRMANEYVERYLK